MRKSILRFSAVALSLLVVGSCFAVDPAVKSTDIPKLSQEEQHATASKRIAALFTRSHYKQIHLDDAFSEKIFDTYLESLDYSRNLFLQSDIDGFKGYRKQFDNALSDGDLSIPYAMYNLSMQRRYERLVYALHLLDKPFDFTTDDSCQFERKGAKWPASKAELDELWRQRVTGQVFGRRNL